MFPFTRLFRDLTLTSHTRTHIHLATCRLASARNQSLTWRSPNLLILIIVDVKFYQSNARVRRVNCIIVFWIFYFIFSSLFSCGWTWIYSVWCFYFILWSCFGCKYLFSVGMRSVFVVWFTFNVFIARFLIARWTKVCVPSWGKSQVSAIINHSIHW